ncbi:MAG TPA: hypothetical protein DCM45_01380 [Clostridiales bacterium]|nr:hypothetical protein [Clostridiales bacterium]
MFCPNCGKSNPDDSKFCENCGSNLLETAAPPPPVQPAPAFTPPPVQPAYAPPPQAQYYPPQNGAVNEQTKPVGVGGYLGMFALNFIPFVGPLIFFIMLFVWAFGSKANMNKKNLSRALLLMMLILIVIYVAIFVVLMAVFPDLIEQLTNSFSY